MWTGQFLEGAKGVWSQCSPVWKTGTILMDGLEGSYQGDGLNVVRSGRPEQF